MPDRTLQTIILAAGKGSRLQGTPHPVPKPLAMVGGRPLLEHVLLQAEVAGCTEAVVVLGSGLEANQVAEHLRSVQTALAVRVVYNRDVDSPNGVSLLAAESVANDRFFVQVADHVFTEFVLSKLEDDAVLPDGAVRLLVDYAPDGIDLEDATKVQVDAGLIRAIGKELATWDAVDTGCFLMDRRVFDALRAAGRGGSPPTLSDGMTRLAEAGLLVAVELGDVAWADVDTPADLARAEGLQCAGSGVAG